MSLFGGTFVRLNGAPVSKSDDEARFGPRGKSPWSAEASEFNIPAGTTVRAGDRAALERLCRYGARPPFRLERLSVLADGKIA